ncbi:solute carrier family 23 protein, partial [Paenibacillus chitinolyticus]
GSVAVVSYQAETIALAGTIGKSMRDRLSMIFVGGIIMTIIGLFGFLEKIVDFIGPVITNGMMAGVGIMLARVSWDMARNNMPVGATSMATGLLTYFMTKA